MSDWRRIRIDAAYRGTNYCGWQRQDANPTVQGEIEAALYRILGKPTAIRGSSRTDTGVHALQQVAIFDTLQNLPTERFAPALNANLPSDIRILHSTEVSPTFDPISDCTRKRYCYLIDDTSVLSPFLAGAVWDYRFGTLDADAMHAAAQAFLGEHDFASFQSAGSPRQSTVRTIFDIAVRRRAMPMPFGPLGMCGGNVPQVIAFEVEGNGFLYKMVRTMVGTLTAIGHGKRTIDWVTEVIAAQNRQAAGLTAPPDGLYLTGIMFHTRSSEPQS